MYMNENLSPMTTRECAIGTSPAKAAGHAVFWVMMHLPIFARPATSAGLWVCTPIFGGLEEARDVAADRIHCDLPRTAVEKGL
jgi:hypothetical protein